MDLHNFDLVVATLSAEEQAALQVRVGILNMFNPCKVEGCYHLDLSYWEQRHCAKMLIHLSLGEPGVNWITKGFTFDWGFAPTQGWDLSVVWFTDGGLPKKGQVLIEVFSGDGMCVGGCNVNQVLRQMLCGLVLPGQRDMVEEIRHGHIFGSRSSIDSVLSGKSKLLSLSGKTRESISIKPAAIAEYFEEKQNQESSLSLSAKLESQMEVFACLSSGISDYSTINSISTGESALGNRPISASSPGLRNSCRSNSIIKDEVRSGDCIWDSRTPYMYTVQDVNEHLASRTAVKWTYANTISNEDPWSIPIVK